MHQSWRNQTAMFLGVSARSEQSASSLYRIYQFTGTISQTIIISYRDGIWLIRAASGTDIHCTVIKSVGSSVYAPTFFTDSSCNIYMKHSGFFAVYPLTPHILLSELSSVPESSLTQLTIE